MRAHSYSPIANKLLSKFNLCIWAGWLPTKYLDSLRPWPNHYSVGWQILSPPTVPHVVFPNSCRADDTIPNRDLCHPADLLSALPHVLRFCRRFQLGLTLFPLTPSLDPYTFTSNSSVHFYAQQRQNKENDMKYLLSVRPFVATPDPINHKSLLTSLESQMPSNVDKLAFVRALPSIWFEF